MPYCTVKLGLNSQNWIKEDWRRVLWTINPLSAPIIMEKLVFGVINMSFMIQIAHKQPLKWPNVWACVSGLNLNHSVRTPSRINGEKDNAQIHKRKFVKELKDYLGIVTMEWPPQLSDLSSIESTEADLEEAVFSAWNTITFFTL
ncbi:8856_t:CDS:2 [Ambispora gerdemannii]|uniref:8856_t:CDS:1 n=1 Tax=Ambispora gerdemannii TaxID=144530 RepID=A0A9N9BS87_9GLOM|nr:8856_t:CDS:2 [Ambispora gerdemannii]